MSQIKFLPKRYALTSILLTAIFNLFAGTKSSTPPITAGTYLVGTGGVYANLTVALTSINSAGGISGPIVLELNALYNATNETLIAVTGASATNTITIRPSTGVTKTITTPSGTNPALRINGAQYFIIDGQAGGVGGIKNLTLINTGNIATVSFINDARNNIIKNCILKGQASSVSNGIVFFGAATTTGNDNNTITNCDITSVSTSAFATNGISSIGTSSKDNDANTISNCNIYDIFNATTKSVGISLGLNTASWTITGNSFYQTASRSSSAAVCAIEINNKTTGNNFTISNNFIGGSTASALGTASVYTFTGSGNFSGINIYGFSGAANVISGNTVKNIAITCNVRNLHYGIYHSDGTANITGNIIGDLTTTGSIVLNSNATTSGGVSPAFTGICGGGGSTLATVGGNVNIQNNSVGSITSNATGGTGANELRGIFYQGNNSLVDISGNTVGGTIANSLYNSGNGATVGIVINSGYAGVQHTVKNNTVQNLSSSNPTTTPNGSLEGITTQAEFYNGSTYLIDAAYIVENNIIKDLTANNAFTMVGFKSSATISTQVITKNQIYNLRNASSLSGSNVVGIEISYNYTSNTRIPVVNPVASSSELSSNIITNLEMSAATIAAGSVAWGISANAGRFNAFNNMIALGYGIGNTPITKSYELIGIANNAVGATKAAFYNFYYNTVHIGGSGVTPTVTDTKCYYGNNVGATILRNNIFYNSRSNAGSSNKHYSLFYTNAVGGTTSDFNVLSAVGAGGVMAGYFNGTATLDYANTNALFAARGIDDNSISALVKFENEANNLRPVPSPDVTNFFIANEALPITGYTTDIDGNTRNSYFPDMGCYEFKGTGCWIGQTSTAWDNNTVSGNWDDGVIPPSNWDVKIFPNVDPAIKQPIMISAAGIGTVKDLYLRTTTRTTTNSSLVTVNTGKLEIYGAVKFRKNNEYTNAIDARFGTIDMKGSSGLQYLTPKWFAKTEIETLTNSNTTGLVIAAPTSNDTLLISKMLNFGNATTSSTLTTNDNITLLSRASATANLGKIVSNTIVGKLNIERYLPARAAWRFLATPITIATSPTIANAWRENNAGLTSNGYGTRVTGPTGPFGATGVLDQYTQRGSVKSYNANTNMWDEVANTNTTTLANASGYMTFVRGDRAVNIGSNGSTVLRMKGNVRTGNQTFAVASNKFESVGNAYPSRIDLRSTLKTNMVNAFIIWNPMSAGSYNVGAYETYVYNSSTGNYQRGATIRNYIESGEAFFVQNNVATAGSLVIQETDKGEGSANVSRVGVTIPTLEINLFAQNTDGSTFLADAAMMNFNSQFSNGVDNNDVRKLLNTYDNIGIKNGVYNLVVERRAHLKETDSIKLFISGMRNANYKIEIDPSVLNDTGLDAFFVDKYLQTSTNMSFTDVTTINFTCTTDASSKATDRFVIVFKAAPTTNFTNITATRNNNKTVDVKWGISNEVSTSAYTVEQSNNGLNFNPITNVQPVSNNESNISYAVTDSNASIQKNWYRIKWKSTNGNTKYSAIAMVNEIIANDISVESTIVVAPSPVIGSNINVYFKNQPKGNYQILLLNALGQVLQKNVVNLNNENYKYSFNGGSLQSGSYQISIYNESGLLQTIPFINKN
jgi:hypothetical protein